MTPAIGAYLFLVAWVLAHLEIQIEGPHGWAAKLPTWRWDTPAVLKWAGKPITGYHVYLLLFILLLMHLPLVQGGFSVSKECDLMAQFFLLAVVWDFLWFACNPHFGLGRFNGAHVWWFRRWFLGLPIPYYQGLCLSLFFYLLPSWGGEPAGPRAARWAVVLAVLLLLTGMVLLANRVLQRRPALPPDVAGGEAP
jgi:hypothetical protein